MSKKIEVMESRVFPRKVTESLIELNAIQAEGVWIRAQIRPLGMISWSNKNKKIYRKIIFDLSDLLVNSKELELQLMRAIYGRRSCQLGRIWSRG